MTDKWKTPAPLYEDPLYGAPSDPCVIRNRETAEWWMFYTQRKVRETDTGVSWMHGSDIGTAVSKDGRKWVYGGIAEGLAFEEGRNTYWAPEVLYANGMYHMFVTYIHGVPDTWSGEARILHYTSENLRNWNYSDTPDTGSDRIIDACAAAVGDGLWKLWYKDERLGSHTAAAVSRDLKNWTYAGEEITDCPHEGPNVFTLGGYTWMLTDTWNGLGVYRSDDSTHWTRQKGDLLAVPGIRPGDGEIGNHADVVVRGERGYMFYFVHPDYPASLRSQAGTQPGRKEQHTVIQCAVLRVKNGQLCCDRNENFDIAGING